LSGDGNTLAVGARVEGGGARGINGNQADNSAQYSGATYLFTWANGSWSQQAYIKSSNSEALDGFGYAVALSVDGNVLVASAYCEQSSARGSEGSQSDNSARCAGAVYRFERTGGLWAQTNYIKSSNTEAHDVFGAAVAISGDGVTMLNLSHRRRQQRVGYRRQSVAQRPRVERRGLPHHSLRYGPPNAPDG